jgi:hypothetical protein
MNAFALIEQFLLVNGLSTCDLRRYCTQVYHQIAIIWHIEDVHQANKTLSYGALSDEQALLILENVERYHDASQGISWDTLTWHITHYFETQGLCGDE